MKWTPPAAKLLATNSTNNDRNTGFTTPESRTYAVRRKPKFRAELSLVCGFLRIFDLWFSSSAFSALFFVSSAFFFAASAAFFASSAFVASSWAYRLQKRTEPTLHPANGNLN